MTFVFIQSGYGLGEKFGFFQWIQPGENKLKTEIIKANIPFCLNRKMFHGSNSCLIGIGQLIDRGYFADSHFQGCLMILCKAFQNICVVFQL